MKNTIIRYIPILGMFLSTYTMIKTPKDEMKFFTFFAYQVSSLGIATLLLCLLIA